MQRRPIFQFDTEASLGLDKVPVGQIISIVAYGVTGPKFYQLMSKSGVTTTTTIAQAVANASLVSASGTASGMPFTPTGTLASTTVQTAIAELDTEKLAVGANAVSATKLATARSIALSGDVTGSATFDGSANISISATVADDSHNHHITTVDGSASCNTIMANLVAGTECTNEVTGQADAPNLDWWFIRTIRHSNASGIWGVQQAHGFNQNGGRPLYTRVISNGVWDSWKPVPWVSLSGTTLTMYA